MKILITGATGLIGQHLTKLLLDRGDTVHFLTSSKTKIVFEDRLKGYYWNPKVQDIDLNCFEGVEYIINLAGASVSKRWTKSHKECILNSRIDSLKLLYTSLKTNPHQVKQIITASGISVYPSSFTKLYHEDEKLLSNDFLGYVVKKWEEAADLLESISIGVTKLRIGIVLSSEGGALSQMEKPIRYLVGAPLGNGKQWQSWIHIEDLVRMFIYTIDQNLLGVYNAVGPNPVQNNRLIKDIGKVLHKPVFLPPVPKLVLKLMLGEMSQIALDSQLVSSSKIEEHGFVFQHPYLVNALQQIYT